MEHPGDDWPRSLRRGGASIALPRRDKELYVTQILSIFVPSISISLSLSSYLRFHGIKMLKAAVSPAFTTRLSLVLMDDSCNNGTR